MVKFPIPSKPLLLFGRPQYIKLYAPFCGWGATASRLYRATTRRQFTFYQKILALIKSISEVWKAEMTVVLNSSGWNPVVLNLYINLIITKYKSKSQHVKLAQVWTLTVNCSKVSSQSYVAGLSKICFLCTCVDQMIYSIFTNFPSIIFKSCHQHFKDL